MELEEKYKEIYKACSPIQWFTFVELLEHKEGADVNKLAAVTLKSNSTPPNLVAARIKTLRHTLKKFGYEIQSFRTGKTGKYKLVKQK